MPPNVEDWAKLLNGVLGKPGTRPGRGSAEDLKRGQAEQQAVDVGSGDRLVCWDGAGAGRIAIGSAVVEVAASCMGRISNALGIGRHVERNDPRARACREAFTGRHSRRRRIETVSR